MIAIFYCLAIAVVIVVGLVWVPREQQRQQRVIPRHAPQEPDWQGTRWSTRPIDLD
jgi:energy-converting hydrogenase Eha subunit F